MKITGYAITQAIKQQELKRDSAKTSFSSSLKAFPDETKKSPLLLADQLMQAEEAIAKLQALQMRYNLSVNVKVQEKSMTLAEAIKRVGGVGRLEKLWRSVATPAESRYSGYDDRRESSVVVAVPTVSQDDAAKKASQYTRLASTFRAAIAVGNGSELEVEDLYKSFFEE